MDRSAIILAGGGSSRFGRDKGLIQLAGRPMISHVLDAVSRVAVEKIVIVKTEAQARDFREVVDSEVSVAVDVNNMKGPLIGAYTGFQRAKGEYSVLLPCDTPLISRNILFYLAELSLERNAVIPRYPNGYIEPLQGVYRTERAVEAAREALDQERFDLRSMIQELKRVRYVSTLVLRRLDPELWTFFNVNNPQDLRKAEAILESMSTYQNC